MRLRARTVAALLGPTNTGKTYRAIQRMLAHKTGMFGLPLRLLAREVYEKVVAQTSSDQVALVTGEEKIVPPGARYFICTVEAMPLDRRVSFVAVDEIQLAGDRQRGHVFTDRLLHTRGLEETLFLGSDTIQGLLEELVPGIQVESAARFSSLTSSGTFQVNSLPKRSAVVAFSAERVYQLAEAVKARHGGTAVVLGALSPRTRNAQVELYQTGQVQHLVATDAIGMGLNLDLAHVTLDAVRKYDGQRFRDLTAAEVGQIAGRAGRYKTPGTFGALRPLELDDELVASVEGHRFSPVRKLYWRNTALNFASVEDLLVSLEVSAPHRALIQVKGEDDQHVLATLQRDAHVMKRVESPELVERLWEVCQVPDFRKTLTDSHVRLIREVAVHLLSAKGQLPDHWVEERLTRLDRTDGDIGTLMSRIAWIRTWTYITYRRDWVSEHVDWQTRTRAIEDRLSDALHEALTARFVDRRKVAFAVRGPIELDDGVVRHAGFVLGTLRGLDFELEPGANPKSVGRVQTELRDRLAERVERLLEDPEFEVDDDHRVRFAGGAVATLEAGPDPFEPNVVLHRLELLTGPQKDRVRAAIGRWVRATIDGLLAPLRRAGGARGAVGGIVYEVERGMGTVLTSNVLDLLGELEDDGHKELARRGIRVGRHALYVPATLKPAMVRVRARLYGVFKGQTPAFSPPGPSATAVRMKHAPEFYIAVGFIPVGVMAVRADVLEKATAELRKLARKGPFPLPDSWVSRLAVDRETAADALVALGFHRRGDRFSNRGPKQRRRR